MKDSTQFKTPTGPIDSGKRDTVIWTTFYGVIIFVSIKRRTTKNGVKTCSGNGRLGTIGIDSLPLRPEVLEIPEKFVPIRDSNTE